MPKCAAFVDELRLAFGVDEISQVIRVGLKADCNMDARVYFSEAGEVLGRPWVPEPGKTLSVGRMVLAKPKPEEVGAGDTAHRRST
jgi:hypothetical protein